MAQTAGLRRASSQGWCSPRRLVASIASIHTKISAPISCTASDPSTQSALACFALLASRSIRWARLRARHVEKIDGSEDGSQVWGGSSVEIARIRDQTDSSRNRQLILCIGNSNGQDDIFLRELTFTNDVMDALRAVGRCGGTRASRLPASEIPCPLGLHWSMLESGDLWYESGGSKDTILSRSESWWLSVRRSAWGRPLFRSLSLSLLLAPSLSLPLFLALSLNRSLSL